ncbi:MAG: HAD family hydrolase [Simkaniaceae bacterium]|nr:HAD family hydrolase [Simkaniaceae bacterium]
MIFDLDDTLIDTRGSIMPGLLKNALRAMREEGCTFDNFATAYSRLTEIDGRARTFREGLSLFLRDVPGSSDVAYAAAVEAVLTHPRFTSPVEQVPGAMEVLTALGRHHTLALVTRSGEEVRKEKMRRAGLSTRLFRKIYSCSEKKATYEKLGEEENPRFRPVIVCGDRISFDLTPAKELNYTTVHIKRGRGQYSTGPKKDVDYTISRLEEIVPIVRQIDRKVGCLR